MNKKMKIREVMLALACVLVMSSVSYAYTATITTSRVALPNDNTGVWDSINSRWVLKGSSVEVMDCGANGQYDPAGSGDDIILRVFPVTYGFPTDDPLGRFSLAGVSVNPGQKIYVRVWNASTETAATHYGTSDVTTVPAGINGDTWDIGGGVAWKVAGPNSIAFYINVPSPFNAPVITQVRPAVTSLNNIITIEGSKFGAGGSGDYVSINNVQVPLASCISWSASSIMVSDRKSVV
jgi:hypothetical protein